MANGYNQICLFVTYTKLENCKSIVPNKNCDCYL